jgi:hypothetical protein
MPLWENVKANLVEWYTVAADKTEEMAKIGMRRYDKFGISRDVERQLAELGNFVYKAHGEGRTEYAEDPTFRAIFTRIQELEAELQRKEEEIEKIKVEARARKREAAAAGTAAAPTAGSDAEATPAEEPSGPSPSGDEAGEDAPSGDEAAGGEETGTEPLIKDPPLPRGRAESAILLDSEELDSDVTAEPATGSDGEAESDPESKVK